MRNCCGYITGKNEYFLFRRGLVADSSLLPRNDKSSTLRSSTDKDRNKGTVGHGIYVKYEHKFIDVASVSCVRREQSSPDTSSTK